MSDSPQPGIYRKGHDTRVADTASEAVALQFEGYLPQTAESVASELSRPELVEQAKALGIKANQSSAALAEAIASHAPEQGEVASGNERPSPELSYVSGLGDGTDEVESQIDDDTDDDPSDES